MGCATLPGCIGMPSKMKDTAMHHSGFHVLLHVVVMSIKMHFLLYITTTQQCKWALNGLWICIPKLTFYVNDEQLNHRLASFTFTQGP